jgi:arylsulfatase A-like enzyme
MAKRDTSAEKKPNILVIWGDDIGVHNISAYNHSRAAPPVAPLLSSGNTRSGPGC